MGALTDYFRKEQQEYYLHTAQWMNVHPQQLLGSPSCFKKYDLHTLTLEELKVGYWLRGRGGGHAAPCAAPCAAGMWRARCWLPHHHGCMSCARRRPYERSSRCTWQRRGQWTRSAATLTCSSSERAAAAARPTGLLCAYAPRAHGCRHHGVLPTASASTHAAAAAQERTRQTLRSSSQLHQTQPVRAAAPVCCSACSCGVGTSTLACFPCVARPSIMSCCLGCSGATHWGQQVFYLQPTIVCDANDEMTASIEVTRKPENHRLLRVGMTVKVRARKAVPRTRAAARRHGRLHLWSAHASRPCVPLAACAGGGLVRARRTQHT